MKITDTEYLLLRALKENCGSTVSSISAKSVDISYGSWNKRMRSGAFSSWLQNLEKLGLIRKLDAQKPIVWMRTSAGTAAVEAPEAKR